MRTRKGDLAATAPASKATSSTPRAPKSSTTVAQRTSSAPIAPTASAEELRAGAPLSPAIRLPALAIMGLAISTVLHALATQFGDGEVGSVARRAEGWGELGAVVGWRSIELGIAWCNGYSASEVAALSLFSQGPVLFLLHYFYNVPAPSTILSLVITILSTTLPIALIPPPKTRRTAEAPEQEGGAKILTTLLVACIHSLVLSISYATFLPTTLVTHFNALTSVAAAHTSTFISLLPLTLISGLAARSFILAPSTSGLSTTKPEFDAVNAGLGEHVRYNLCGYSERMKEVLRRTAILAGLGGANTFALVMGLGGVEACGAVAYAGVWVAAVVVSGVALGVVGDVDV
ncbi:hypothetical protein VC83_05373 [Pseudogymnoascus destructans]|uniref:Uncharacterized protein n=2 Tax=Pseudogymnoascus destructans TaxID=655981 RepID=L8G0R1_PSED2|nr:uncharacterized protein VC83_05373 [Pseudogymnoascus destructans]ELR06369.1 hypothetical protein GMDG_02086 [Pseudogymnoascus destructans 20631-21]OAF58133.1 hypothetical protein VC83_05373 [Pseudogymnoascus destructans]